MPLQLPAPQPGTQMAVQKFGARVQQGSQVYILIGGKPIGYITHLDQNDSDGTQAFYGMGTIMPLELQPLQWSGSLTVSGARLWELGWQSQFMYPGSAILTQGLVNIMVYNQNTQTYDALFLGCVPTTYSSSWASNAFSLQTGAWMYQNIKVPNFGGPSTAPNPFG
jgi:hypothetical protein